MISSQIPAVRSRSITGSDKVDLWTNQGIWDGALDDVRIVISTHQVLADALGHGFVKISRLALLVYDEGTSTSFWNIAIGLTWYSPSLSKEPSWKQNHARFLPSHSCRVWPRECAAYSWSYREPHDKFESRVVVSLVSSFVDVF